MKPIIAPATASMPRTYNDPPVVEAACEFRFLSQHGWDWAIPGLVYEKIKDTFPERRQQAGLEITLAPGSVAELPAQLPAAPIQRMQFLHKDGSGLVQVGPNLLAVNQLKPYSKWPNFKAMILKQLEVYREVAEPDSFARVGLRYINRINLPALPVELKDYFVMLPEVPQQVPQVWRSFFMAVNVAYNEPESTLRVAIGNLPAETPDQYPLMLDLDLFTEPAGTPSFDEIDHWLETAHDRLEQAFDSSVTEKTHKEVFKEVDG